jgi:hypothetical protein
MELGLGSKVEGGRWEERDLKGGCWETEHGTQVL